LLYFDDDDDDDCMYVSTVTLVHPAKAIRRNEITIYAVKCYVFVIYNVLYVCIFVYINCYLNFSV